MECAALSRYRLVFDLDDTLYPERQFALSGFRAAAHWARETLGQPLEGLENEMAGLLDEGHLGGLFGQVLGNRLGAEAAERHREAFIAAWRDHEPEIALFDDAHRCLTGLGLLGPGVLGGAALPPVGLISDGTASMQAAKVRALGLDGAFAHVVFTHGLGGRQFAKPHPASFEAMEQALGAPGITLVYIGDNPSKDFVTPNARGWLSVQIDRPEAESGHRRIHHAAATAPGGAPQRHIRSLDELAEVLAR